MGNKIGKYSTGLKGAAKMAGSPYGQSNKGTAAVKNEMAAFHEMEPRQKPKPTYVGAAPDPTVHRSMSRYSKK